MLCVRPILVSFALLFSTLLLPAQSLGANEPDLVEESVRDLMTVVAFGAGGAVLGLSTLSFVKRPSKHLKNIIIGGALGIIVGVGVVAYNQANQGKDFYWENAPAYIPPTLWEEMGEQDTFMGQVAEQRNTVAASAPQLLFNFSF